MSDDTNFFQKQVAKLPDQWKLATVRCCIYAGMVGGQTYLAGVRGFDTFAEMGGLYRFNLMVNIVISVGGVWVAFLDQSMTAQKPSGIRAADISPQIAADKPAPAKEQT